MADRYDYTPMGSLPPVLRSLRERRFGMAKLPMAKESDETSPAVSIIDPPPGTPIGRSQPIRLRVTDDTGLRNVILYLRFSGQQASEVVHDGCCFLAPYTQGSRRTVIAGGFEFSLMRQGGWPGNPSLSVRAFDTGGNEGQ